MPVVTSSVVDGIAIVVVDHPPVNALSQAVRQGIVGALDSAEADTNVRGIVLTCAGRTFIAGADIREFGLPLADPTLPSVVDRLENATKPIVAAIHGTALGGGCEVALACHYRVASRDAKVGLPEVKLGIIPAAGGTQRLPRLVGVERAIAMITDGAPISASDALACGAVDEVVESQDSLVDAALAAANRLATQSTGLRRTGGLPAPSAAPDTFQRAADDVAKKYRGAIAPRRSLDAIRCATEMSFSEGLRREREIFLELRDSEQAAALRYAFFGEREVARPPGLAPDTPVRAVSSAAIVGAGTMGGGIAMAFANAGIPVTLMDGDAASLEKGMATIRRNYASAVSRQKLSQTDCDARLALIRPTLRVEDVSEADVVIEAVFEDAAVKRDVFGKIDAVAKPGAILATNTSYLDVETIASFTTRPQDVVGMHFFSPANVMRLLEVVRTSLAAPDVLMTAMALGRRLGKLPVLVGGTDGFVGNRMLAQRTREAYFLLEEGALPEQVDRVLTDFGFPMGPFAVGDLAGLDIGWRNRKARAHLRRADVRDSSLLDTICELGRFGQKTGQGWFNYPKGSRTPQSDPDVEQLIVEHSRQIGITRRQIPDEEILTRCLCALINEGGRIIDEGVVGREVDVDMIWVHGYGFPSYRGGPLFYAQQLGYSRVMQSVLDLEQRFGSHFWRPSEWLRRKAMIP